MTRAMAPARARLVICSDAPGASDPLEAIDRRLVGAVKVRSLGALYRHLEQLARDAPAERPDTSLELIGPANGQGLLELGASVIDGAALPVLDLFGRMAEERLLKRLHVLELRLLGCRTAIEQPGQDTIHRLAQILRVRVLGATGLLYAAHFGPGGLEERFEHLLVDEGGLAMRRPTLLMPDDAPPAAAFTLDAVPAVAAADLAPVAWPRFVVPRSFDARSLPRMLRAGEGRSLPGLLAARRCELLVPTAGRNGDDRYHVLEILFNWSLVRVLTPQHPEGAVYPVISPARFVRIFIELPQLHRVRT